ncbi:MAG: nucleoside triphosphate pyrophosphohydrolase [Pseudomonadota bacterium]
MTNPPKPNGTIQPLLDVMAALRDPATGCAWDVKQTFESIVPYTLEEAYEVADAIARGDVIDLEEELGDLLLQVVYHARMAEEAGAFSFGDVADGITKKMVRRHPHVFGSDEERRQGAVPGMWDRIKAEEKREKAEKAALRVRNSGVLGDTGADCGGGSDGASICAEAASDQTALPSQLDDVPAALPALVRAVKLQQKAAKVGFDWPDLKPVLAKMREELDELEAELTAQDVDAAKVSDEFGDLLFVMANVARHLKLDPENALRSTNAKFTRRFQMMERWLAAEGRQAAECSLSELDALWDRAKRAEHKG